MDVVGPWPGPCPVPAGARAALWDDGSLCARVATAWLTLGELDWLALRAGENGFAPAGPLTAPGGWGPAQAAASQAGASWLVLPWHRVPHDAPGRLQAWAAAEAALAAAGTGLWLPFAHLDPKALARLAVAVGVDPKS